MNNLSLYTISNAFAVLMEQEEMTENEKKQVYDELTNLLNAKSQSVIGYTRNLELTIDAMKEEEKRIAENRKTLEKRLSNFKEYVKDCMEKGGFTKIETELGQLSIAKNPMSVEIENKDLIPNEFKTEVITVNVDKTAIKNHFKETGELIPGAKIISEKTSLRIK